MFGIINPDFYAAFFDIQNCGCQDDPLKLQDFIEKIHDL